MEFGVSVEKIGCIYKYVCSRRIILIDNGQLTIDNFGREEKNYTKNTFVPDCINIVIVFKTEHTKTGQPFSGRPVFLFWLFAQPVYILEKSGIVLSSNECPPCWVEVICCVHVLVILRDVFSLCLSAYVSGEGVVSEVSLVLVDVEDTCSVQY